MSKGQLARTPENFPRMRYRARKRHARKQFESAFMLAFRTWPEFHALVVDAIEAAVDQLTRALNIPEARDDLVVAARRSPWFEYLAEAEARGATGSGEIGHGQCGCADCEKADDERLKRTPIEEIMREHQAAQATPETPAAPDSCACGPGECKDPWADGCRPTWLDDAEAAAIMAAEADPDYGKDHDDE